MISILKDRNMRKGVLMGSSFLLFLIVLTAVSFTLVGHFLDTSPYFLHSLEKTSSGPSMDPVEANTGPNFWAAAEFPPISYGEQYAKMTIPSANLYDEPIYFGDSEDILLKGIGHFSGSRFPGQRGNCVMSAHVMGIFRYLEDVSIGATVQVDTKYGDYVYEVYDQTVFEAEDPSLLFPTDGTERLTLYTCYPFNYTGTAPRPQRIALLCKKISGKDWKSEESSEAGEIP